MNDFFQFLFRYDAWATGRVIDALEGKVSEGNRILELLAHILIAKRVWLLRIAEGDSSRVGIWPQLSLEQCRELFGELEFELTEFLDKSGDDFGRRMVRYRSQRGDEFVNSLADILLHMSHHAAYHRGQIAVLMRQQGLEPVNTDYIAFIRSLAAGAASTHQNV